MTVSEWLIEFNKILLSDFENRDDDLFAQVSIVERYLQVYGALPTDPDKFHRIEKAYLFYVNEIVPAIGEFPNV